MTGLNAFIFSIDHPFDKDFQVCSNEVPGVTNGYALRGHMFKKQKPSKIFFS